MSSPQVSWSAPRSRSGKPVVTANKELLAVAGPEVFAAAEAAGVDLLFEAAVAGGIPFVRPLRESLLGEPVERVLGIMNGTTNYILTRMTEAGADFAEALAEAQDLGYAEADPTADVEGFDAGAKIAIVASLAFGARVRAGDVHLRGHQRADRRRHRLRRPQRLRREAPGRRRALRRRPSPQHRGSRPPDLRARHASPGLGPRELQRRVRAGRRGRRPHVLRPGGGR